MYALLAGILAPGEDFKEIQYKEIARAEKFSDLTEAYNLLNNIDPKDPEILKEEYASSFISKPEDTRTLFGPGFNGKQGDKKGYGLRLRFIEVQ